MTSSGTPALGHRRKLQGPPPAPHLFLVLDCDRPLQSPQRHSLAGLDEVAVGRAEIGFARREGTRLALGVDGQWLSSSHARLVREAGRWVIEDLQSTNGTVVNGAAVERAQLSDQDVIELGHTIFLYRESVQRRSEDALDVSASALTPPVTALRTLVPALAADLARLGAIARSNVSVVIGGETGTGKEIIARAIHELSGRAGPFVAVNCGALSRTLVESELFGHRKGSFSGADEDRPGLVRSADRGTLLLDEIGDLPAPAQAALLRVLQESEVLAVGSTRPVKVDVRVLAATHRDLEALVVAGEFRADLLARITGFTLRMPPLRWRREDLGLLIAALLQHIAPGERAGKVHFTGDAARALLRYRWPLNIRELEKCLTAALILAGDGAIDLPHLPEAVRAALNAPLGATPALAVAGHEEPAEPAAPAELDEADVRQREELVALLREHRGNVTAVARAMGKARMQIHRWIKKYRLALDAYRP